MKNSNVPDPSKRFYVYTLADPHDKIFYVGKGCGPRVFQHEDEARKGCECHKCRKIRKIWRIGGEVRKYIVFETDNEDEAYEHERQLICDIGLKSLCNVTEGGRGKRSMTDDDIARMKIAIEDRAHILREQKHQEQSVRAFWYKQEKLQTKRGPQKRKGEVKK